MNRLLYALIINEQNLIQLPIIINPFYQKYIIDSFPFKLQDICNFNYLLLPTMNGELFGLTIHKFHSLDRRIEVGKSLAQLLFHAKNYWKITEFVQKTTHTGSRSDYERYIQKEISRNTPYLRLTYPIIEHRTIQLEPWDQSQTLKKEWFTPPKLKKMNKLTKWYF